MDTESIAVILSEATLSLYPILIKNVKSFKYHLILNNKKCGKGFCIKEGVKQASGEIIVIQDADLEYDPADYYNLINPINDKSYSINGFINPVLARSNIRPI
jgi:hypothetical protein